MQVMDASRGIEDKNQNLKIVMAQVASSSNELAWAPMRYPWILQI